MEIYLICLAAALVGGLMLSRLTKKLNLPAVTAYLVAGLLLGPFCLGRLHIPGMGFNTLEQVEAELRYFPNLEKVVMCNCGFDNETMAAFREKMRPEYKVVWSVKCGKVATRTDATFFMPVKYHVYYLKDHEAYNLRYCPELRTVDIGHMAVSDIRFVEYLPNLEHLILAHTNVRDIEPLRSCKKLKFLELDWTGIQDFSPLLDCTGLEDLNVGNTWGNIEPLRGMTWLKNLWMIYRREGREMAEALPDTRVVYYGTATVDSGWRDLPNYFAMRDALKMYYMSW